MSISSKTFRRKYLSILSALTAFTMFFAEFPVWISVNAAGDSVKITEVRTCAAGDTLFQVNWGIPVNSDEWNECDITVERFEVGDKLMLNPRNEADFYVSEKTDIYATVCLVKPIAGGEQIRIVMPAMTDDNGNSFIYYLEAAVPPVEDAENLIYETMVNDNFEDYDAADGSTPPSGYTFETIAGGNGARCYSDTIDIAHGKSAVVEVTNNTAAYGGFVKEADTIINDLTEYVELSFEFYLNEQTASDDNKHRMWSGIKSGNVWRYGANIFTNNNQWIYKDGALNGDNIKVGARNIPGWNTFKTVYTPADDCVEYSMNGTVMGKFPSNTKIDSKELGNIVLGGGSDKSEAKIAYDNVRLVHAQRSETTKSVSFVKFIDDTGKIIPTDKGKAPSGASAVVVGLDSSDSLASDDVCLMCGDRNIVYSGECKEGIYIMNLSERLLPDTGYELTIDNERGIYYSAEFSTNATEEESPRTGDVISKIITDSVSVGENRIRLDLDTFIPYLTAKELIPDIKKYSESDKMMLYGQEVTDYTVTAIKPESIEITFGEKMEADTQYRIALPQITDYFGNSIEYSFEIAVNDAIGVTGSEIGKTIFREDFESYESNDGDVPPDGYYLDTIAGTSAFKCYSHVINDSYGKSMVIETISNESVYGGAVKPIDTEITDKTERVDIKFDFYLNEQTASANDKHRMWSGIRNGGAWRCGVNIFTNSNQWVYVNGALSGNGTSAANRKAPGWNTAEIKYMPQDNTVTYYLNDTKLGTFAANTSITDSKLGDLVLGGGSDIAGAMVAYDNLSVTEYIKVKKDVICIKFKDEDGKIIQTADGTAPAGAKYILITFSGAEQVDDKNVSLISMDNEQHFKGEFSNGTYTMTLDKMLSGERNYSLRVEGVTESDYVFDFITNDDGNRTALEKLNCIAAEPSSTAEDIMTYLEDNRDALKFKFTLYDDESICIDKLKVSEYLLECVRKNPLETEDADAAIHLFKNLVIAQALNEKKINDFGEYESYIEMDERTRKLCKDFGEKARQEVAVRLWGREIESVNELRERTDEAVILSAVHFADGYGEVRNVLQKCEDLTGIDTSGISTDIYKAVANKEYADFAAMKSDVERLKKQQGNNSAGSGGGSGGGSGRGNSVSTAVNKGISSNVSISNTDVKTEPIAAGFSDVPYDAWYLSELMELVQRNILQGRATGKFEPDSNVTRAEAVKMIVLTLQLKKTGESHEFVDVSENDWFYDYVLSAADNHIVNGMENNTFCPDLFITRQDMAVILRNSYNVEGTVLDGDNIEEKFKDNDEIEPYAREAVNELKQARLINGYEDGTFRPKDNLTRCEAAKLIYELLVLTE